jgi:hypothetical protein
VSSLDIIAQEEASSGDPELDGIRSEVRKTPTNRDNYLIGFDKKTGEVRWEFQPEGIDSGTLQRQGIYHGFRWLYPCNQIVMSK